MTIHSVHAQQIGNRSESMIHGAGQKIHSSGDENGLSFKYGMSLF